MTAHTCTIFDPACYRCDLSRDECTYPPHECDTGDFDRIVCPPPCETMHSYCSVCGKEGETCLL